MGADKVFAGARWHKDGSFIERIGAREGPSLRDDNPQGHSQVLDSRRV